MRAIHNQQARTINEQQEQKQGTDDQIGVFRPILTSMCGTRVLFLVPKSVCLGVTGIVRTYANPSSGRIMCSHTTACVNCHPSYPPSCSAFGFGTVALYWLAVTGGIRAYDGFRKQSGSTRRLKLSWHHGLICDVLHIITAFLHMV